MKRKWLIGSALILLPVTAVLTLWSLDARSSRFESARWKAESANESHENPRAGMIVSLEKELKPGMSRADIESLLGEPEGKEGNRYSYFVGTVGYGVDLDEFVIEFDAEGRLARFYIRQG